ncbi:MAG: hypothetical protein ACD_42C00069G0003 [uncultured bacterium]|nr:MAG: hypothetical protein ACD_42C00069G0003 [uncultured bacterium]
MLRAPNTVFTFKELALRLGLTDAASLRSKIHYYVKTGALYSIRKGFYAKDENYSALEFATKIYTPAYVSFETVLVQTGVVFQTYRKIFVASYLSREIYCDHHHFSFKKIKHSILTNRTGVSQYDYYFIADKERALLDTIYLNKEYYFDNLNSINWDKCFEMLPLYENKNMEKRLTRYFEESHHA